MSSRNSTALYLKKRGISGPWKINPATKRKFDQVIVIPAFSELEFLTQTLSSINKNKLELLKYTLVVVVVNNSKNSPIFAKENNQLTLQNLNVNDYQFTLGVIDAASSYIELPQKHAGVGLARKIGMDLALPHLATPQSLIFCTDADTTVSNDYIEKVQSYFDKTDAESAVVGFRHLESNDKKMEQEIRLYEKYLLATAQKMRDAGSPYGYVAMGSTMVCTTEAYCAVGGMPRKKATEDFYFLQELAKYCKVHTIPETLVFPSSRPVPRVYLGTGFRMKQAENGFNLSSLYYSDDAFDLLSKWLNLGSNSWRTNIDTLLEKTIVIHPHLMNFLKQEKIEDIWTKIQKNAPSKSHFSEQFHRWFDGLKTIRLMNRFTRN